MKKFFFGTIVVLLLLAGGVWWWYQSQLRPVSQVERVSYITIEEGKSAREVANTLAERGLVRSGWAFYTYTHINDQAHSLQAGFYRLSPTQSTPDIVAALVGGDIDMRQVRIPSGVDLLGITETLENEGFSEAEVKTALGGDYDLDILRYKPSWADLEGYLYPDTYVTPSNTDATQLIETILTHTDEVVNSEIKRNWERQGLGIHEGLTLASIVQREVADAQEQRQVAQVFLLRLDKGMKLEADPTYMYAARREGVDASPDLSSPYNTYRVEGLPPGPISNAETSALEAVANPADTDYLYFVTGQDGETRFSETLQQHEALIEEHGISGT